MSLEDEYRRHAAHSLELANGQADDADKNRLLVMAEAWLELAGRIAKHGKKQRATVDHPLVEKALGSDRPSAK